MTINGPEVIKMRVEDWLPIEDNPRQRDTERHAKRARHLREYSPTHAEVKMAIVGGRRKIKLDGHTRALLWGRGTLKAPPELSVAVYRVDSMAEVKKLYMQFDALGAVETKIDMVLGAYRESSFQPTSFYLRRATISEGLRLADAYIQGRKQYSRKAGDEIYGIVEKFLPQIQALDSINCSAREWNNGLFAAFILTHLRYGDECLEFWEKYNGDDGAKGGGKMDGVQLLREEISRRRIKKRMSGIDNVVEVSGRALGCFENYRESQWSSRISSIPPHTYVKTPSGRPRILPEFRSVVEEGAAAPA